MLQDDTDSTTKNFIVLEGIDGSGTTTQLARLASFLESRELPCFVTAEPTKRPEGRLIRSILKGELEADPGTVAYLFAADRHEHLHGRHGIAECLAAGKIVVCDRYVWSSLAYQGLACGEDLPASLNARFPKPGLTLFFRIDPEHAMARVSTRQALEIYEKMHIQKQVAAAYEKILASELAHPARIVIIDAEKPLEDVTAQVRRAVCAQLGLECPDEGARMHGA
jgi:dTMP kinase